MAAVLFTPIMITKLTKSTAVWNGGVWCNPAYHKIVLGDRNYELPKWIPL